MVFGIKFKMKSENAKLKRAFCYRLSEADSWGLTAEH